VYAVIQGKGEVADISASESMVSEVLFEYFCQGRSDKVLHVFDKRIFNNNTLVIKVERDMKSVCIGEKTQYRNEDNMNNKSLTCPG
jgi:hypothetical protein